MNTKEEDAFITLNALRAYISTMVRVYKKDNLTKDGKHALSIYKEIGELIK